MSHCTNTPSKFPPEPELPGAVSEFLRSELVATLVTDTQKELRRHFVALFQANPERNWQAEIQKKITRIQWVEQCLEYMPTLSDSTAQDRLEGILHEVGLFPDNDFYERVMLCNFLEEYPDVYMKHWFNTEGKRVVPFVGRQLPKWPLPGVPTQDGVGKKKSRSLEDSLQNLVLHNGDSPESANEEGEILGEFRQFLAENMVGFKMEHGFVTEVIVREPVVQASMNMYGSIVPPHPLLIRLHTVHIYNSTLRPRVEGNAPNFDDCISLESHSFVFGDVQRIFGLPLIEQGEPVELTPPVQESVFGVSVVSRHPITLSNDSIPDHILSLHLENAGLVHHLPTDLEELRMAAHVLFTHGQLLPAIPRLRRLTVSGNTFRATAAAPGRRNMGDGQTDAMRLFEFLQRHSSLTHLELEQLAIPTTSLLDIRLSHLQSFVFRDCHAEHDRGQVRPVSFFLHNHQESLTSVEVENAGLTGQDLHCLLFPKLERACFPRNSSLCTSDGYDVVSFLTRHPQLTDIDLSGTGVTGNVLDAIQADSNAEYPQLTKLRIADGVNVAGHVGRLLQRCGNRLEVLDLQGCVLCSEDYKLIGSDTLYNLSIGNSCTDRQCNTLHGEVSLAAILRRSPRLARLSVQADCLTKEEWDAIGPEVLPYLQELEVRGDCQEGVLKDVFDRYAKRSLSIRISVDTNADLGSENRDAATESVVYNEFVRAARLA